MERRRIRLSLYGTTELQNHTRLCLPVNEDDDEHDEGHDGGPHPDPHLSLQGERGLGLTVVLNPAQREVQVPHFHLESTITDTIEAEKSQKSR